MKFSYFIVIWLSLAQVQASWTETDHVSTVGCSLCEVLETELVSDFGLLMNNTLKKYEYLKEKEVDDIPFKDYLSITFDILIEFNKTYYNGYNKILSIIEPMTYLELKPVLGTIKKNYTTFVFHSLENHIYPGRTACHEIGVC